jgi:hypothetical protein
MTDQTTKPSVTTAIRRLVVANRTMPAKDIQAAVEADFPGVKMSTVVTIRADALSTLRVAEAMGLLRSPAEPAPKPPATRPHRSRSRARRQAAPVTEEVAATD